MAENDWIVAGINNPDFTVSDFANFADLTTDNTQLLGVDDYINSDFIQGSPYFKDQAGNFDEDRFRNYYAARAQEFDQFAQDEFYRGPALDMFDLDRTPDTPVIDTQFNITRGYNPDRQQIGIEGVNIWSDPKFSQRELAKQNLVFNTERGEFEDFTVNDHVLVSNPVEWLKSLWKDPLVLATWDEDGTHIDPLTGLQQEHVKGQPKLNDKGTYYYETLGKRSVLGKDVLSMFDTFTVDGQGLNKYDFFDSNDLKQSIGGTIMKNAAMLLPMFVPSIAGIYSGVLMARELTKTLPMLTGMVTSLTGGDTPQWAETASAWAQRMTPSSDDWSRTHPFAAGHFIGLVTDLAILTGQQKFIADSLGVARGSKRIIDEANANAKALFATKAPQYTAAQAQDVWQACLNRYMPQAEKLALKSGQLGRDLGLAYIALTFQGSTYDEMLLHGASKQEASAVALGAILGMFSVDKWLHLGEIFYDDATGNATKIARQIAKQEADTAMKSFKDKSAFAIERNNQLGILKMIRDAKENVEGFFGDYSSALKYHTLTVTGKMIGSGVERISETLCGDISKGLYELAGKMGANTKAKDVGAFENMGERYGMAFLAGVLGSGVFYVKELLQRGTIDIPKLSESLETLVRNGYADELRSEVDKLEKEGKLGNKKLSASREILDNEGNIIGYETAKPGEETQSGYLARTIKENITAIESAIKGNEVGMTDEELFDNAVMGEERLRRYQAYFPATGYYDRVAKLTHDYFKARIERESAEISPSGNPYVEVQQKDGTKKTVLAKYAKIYDKTVQDMPQSVKDAANKTRESYREAEEDALKRYRDFIGGDTSLRYSRMLMFGMDPELSDYFLTRLDSSIDIENFCKDLYKKEISELTPEEFVELSKRYNANRKSVISDKTNLEDAFSKYEELEKQTAPIVENVEKYQEDFKNHCLNIFTTLNFIKQSGRLADRMIDYDKMLPGESEEDFQIRNTRYVDEEHNYSESEADFAKRKEERQRMVDDYNRNVEDEFVNNISKLLDDAEWRVDPMTKRMIKDYISEYGRPHDIIKNIIDASDKSEMVKSILSELKGDLSNEPDVIAKLSDTITETLTRYYRESFENWYNDLIYNTELDVGEGQSIDPAAIFNRFDESDRKLPMVDLFNNILDGKIGEQSKNSIGILTDEGKSSFMDLIRKSLNSDIDPEFLRKDIDSMLDIEFNTDEYESYISRNVENRRSLEVNNAYSVIDSIKKNNFINLVRKIDTDIVNPVEEIVRQLAEAKGKQLPKPLSDMLDTIWDNYDNIDKVTKFNIDSGMMNDIKTLGDLMKQLRLFITAASKTPDIMSPVGHNVSINQFASKNQSKLSKPWKHLPEIDMDIATLYNNILLEAEEELERFVRLSENNSVNKEAKIKETDIQVSKMNVKTILAINVSDDAEYEGQKFGSRLVEGLESLKDEPVDGENAMITDAKARFMLYENVHSIAKGYGLSVVDFFDRADLIRYLMTEDEIRQVFEQKNIRVDENMDTEMTPYGKLMFFLTMLSQRPEKYYADYNKFLEPGARIPLGPQKIGAGMVRSFVTGNFSRMLESVQRKHGTNSSLPWITRILHVTGIAGSGKTFSVMGANADLFDGMNLYIVGPSKEVAERLASNIGKNGEKTLTVDEMMTKLLGTEKFNELSQYVNGKKDKNIYNLKDRVETNKEGDDNKFYKRIFDDSLGGSHIELKDEMFSEWAKNDEEFDAIVLDESQLMPVVYEQIVQKYLKDTGKIAIFAGDLMQQSFMNYTSFVRGFDNINTFTARTPEMLTSMRAENKQMFDNQEKITRRIDMIQDDINNHIDTKDKIVKYKNSAKEIRPAYYATGNDVNGTMIVDRMDESTVGLIKSMSDSGKKILFIGDSGSENLKKIRDAGVTIEQKSFEKINGAQEDYVVVDWRGAEEYDYDKITAYELLTEILKQVNTWMTRGKKGVIMIDNGVSEYIGKSERSLRKADAPSMENVIQGVKETDSKAMQRIMELIDTGRLDEEDEPDSGSVDTTAKGATKDNGSGKKKNSKSNLAAKIDLGNAFSQNPESRVKGAAGSAEVKGMNKNITEALKNLCKDDILYSQDLDNENDDNGYINSDQFNRLFIAAKDPKVNLADGSGYEFESYDIPVLSVGRGKVIRKGDDTRPEVVEWNIVPPEKGDIRNLQSFVTEKTVLKKYAEKIEYQKMLDMVRMSAMDDIDTYDSLPEQFKRNVSKEKWQNRRIIIEVRKADDKVKPINSPFRELGMEIDGSGVRTYVNYVLLLGDNNGRTVKIDLAGMNNPATLNDNIATLKVKFARAAKEYMDKGDEANAKRMRNMADSIEDDAKRYADWFGRLATRFASGGRKPICYDVTEKVQKSLRTWFVSNKGQPVRLDGYVDLRTIDTAHVTKYDVNNLRMRYPGFLISDVYVFQDYDSADSGLEPGLKNRACVAVTAFRNEFDQETLMESYLSQRETYRTLVEQGLPTPPPKIRLIMLGNEGLTLRQILDSHFTEKVTGKAHDWMPMNENYMGAGMLLQLWNARAYLNKFVKTVDKWSEDRGLSPEMLNDLAEIYDMRYYGEILGKGKMSHEEVGRKLEEKHLDTTIENGEYKLLNDLYKLNNEELSRQHFFRLGSYLKKYDTKFERNLGFHIQEYNVNREVFNKDKAYMIALTYECAKGFQTMLDGFLNPLVGSSEHPNAPFLIESAKGRRRRADQPFKKIGDNESIKTIEGMLVKLKEGDDSIVNGVKYHNYDYMSIFPRIIKNVGIILRKFRDEEIPYDDLQYELDFSRIKISKDSDAGMLGKVTFDLGGWIDREAAGVQGYNFIDMLSVLFHGTSENPTRRYGVEDTLRKAEDARFKYGFFIEPGSFAGKSLDITVTDNDGNDHKMILRRSNTSGEYFTVNVNMRGPAFRMSRKALTEIMPDNPENEAEILSKKTVTTVNAAMDTLNSELVNMLNRIDLNSIDAVKDYLSAVEVANSENNVSKVLSNVMDMMKSVEDKLVKNGNVFDWPELGSERDYGTVDGYVVVKSTEDGTLTPGTFVIDRIVAPGVTLPNGEKIAPTVEIRENPAKEPSRVTGVVNTAPEPAAVPAVGVDSGKAGSNFNRSVDIGGRTIGNAYDYITVNAIENDKFWDGLEETLLNETGSDVLDDDNAKMKETGARKKQVREYKDMLKSIANARSGEEANKFRSQIKKNIGWQDVFNYIKSFNEELEKILFEIC